MPVLRSRKVDSVTQNEQSHKPLINGDQIEPPTPAKEVESTTKPSHERTPSPYNLVHSSDKTGSVGSIDSESVSNIPLRRSARLSSKSSSYNVVENVGSRRKRKNVNSSVQVSASGIEKESGGSKDDVIDVRDSNGYDREDTLNVQKVKNQRLLSHDICFLSSESVQECDLGNKTLSLRSGKKLLKPEIENVAIEQELSPYQKDEKETEEGNSDTVVHEATQVTESLTFEAEEGSSGTKNDGEKTRKRFSTEDKQKGVMVDDDSKEPGLEKKINISDAEELKIEDVNDTIENVTLQQEAIKKAETSTRNKERFKSVARENASKFAYFSPQEEVPLEDEEEEVELPQTKSYHDMEDWPGPFSTAMKIIKDREANSKTNTSQQNSLTSNKLPLTVPLIWVPKVKQNHQIMKRTPPSLQELCMSIMAENVDAISSLESVPDVLRHRLTQQLCDTRKMNHHFLNLLASGSPSEIRIRDCSWLTEENFTKTIENTDTSKLTVLQLDQCGRCLPDYVLFSTLSHKPMCELTNISLRGACRLSDSGLNTLVTCAPGLRSINLGCCSLLTSDGIINLSDKLGPILKELYIDECFGLDAMKILPALIKLQHLEVLSVSRNESVNDLFIRQLVNIRGKNMKELILADCPKLTDKSVKAIAESCPELCSIDLSNLRKLTDTSLGYLANGCREIQTMKFCRNSFSDEAIAAYLEACGKPLKELSLNHVNKVGNHTALSLAKHAKKLESLDLSWCRNMTNEAVGLIVDSCLSLETLKLFGCTQINDVFLDGHSNEMVKVIGLKGSQILKNIELPYLLPLRYSSAT
ncbi:hypothetical protein LXL04_027799 [Taraxacum kok-saghyz]